MKKTLQDIRFWEKTLCSDGIKGTSRRSKPLVPVLVWGGFKRRHVRDDLLGNFALCYHAWPTFADWRTRHRRRRNPCSVLTSHKPRRSDNLCSFRRSLTPFFPGFFAFGELDYNAQMVAGPLNGSQRWPFTSPSAVILELRFHRGCSFSTF